MRAAQSKEHPEVEVQRDSDLKDDNPDLAFIICVSLLTHKAIVTAERDTEPHSWALARQRIIVCERTLPSVGDFRDTLN